MHLSAGCVFKQQTLLQMLDFHEGLGGWLAECLAGWLAGWPAGWQVGSLAGRQRHQNPSKTNTLIMKVRQKRVPLRRKSFPKRGCLAGYTRNPKIIFSQNCIDFDTKTYRFGHISGPSYREHMLVGRLAGLLAGWLAGWGTKMRKKRVPLGKKCVKNVYP